MSFEALLITHYSSLITLIGKHEHYDQDKQYLTSDAEADN